MAIFTCKLICKSPDNYQVYSYLSFTYVFYLRELGNLFAREVPKNFIGEVPTIAVSYLIIAGFLPNNVVHTYFYQNQLLSGMVPEYKCQIKSNSLVA